MAQVNTPWRVSGSSHRLSSSVLGSFIEETSPLGCWEKCWNRKKNWRKLDSTQICPSSCYLAILPSASWVNTLDLLAQHHSLTLNLGWPQQRKRHDQRLHLNGVTDSTGRASDFHEHTAPLASAIASFGEKDPAWKEKNTNLNRVSFSLSLRDSTPAILEQNFPIIGPQLPLRRKEVTPHTLHRLQLLHHHLHPLPR